MAQEIGKLLNGASYNAAVTNFGIVLQCTAEYFGEYVKAHNASGGVDGAAVAGESGLKLTLTIAIEDMENEIKANDIIRVTLPDSDGQRRQYIVESCKITSDLTGEEVDTAEVVAVQYFGTRFE